MKAFSDQDKGQHMQNQVDLNIQQQGDMFINDLSQRDEGGQEMHQQHVGKHK